MIPNAELDLAATIAANSGVKADAYCPPNPHRPGAAEGVHEGVTCDKSGMCPIVGPRYHLVGHNYDLCEDEFNKLDAAQKYLYRKIEAPKPKPAAGASPNNTTTTNNNNNNSTNNNNGNSNSATTNTTNINNPNGIHPGVTCDKSGMSPIV